MLKRLTLGLLLTLAAAPALPQGVPISALPSATVPLTGAELMLVMQNGAAKKATVLQVGQAFNLGGTCTNCTLAGTTLLTGTLLGGTLQPSTPLAVAYGGTAASAAGATAANNIGALAIANNLSDLASAAAARTALGLGTAAVKAASDNTKATLASISGAITAGHIATFADTSGTVQDGGTAITTPVSLANGGTGAALTASTGGIVYSGASAMAILSGTATANQVLMSGSSAAPAWSTATYPATTVSGQILFSSATNVVSGSGNATLSNGALTLGSSGIAGSVILNGSGSGTLTLKSPASSGSNTLTFPAGTTDFSATGGTGQVVRQSSSGGALTVATLACSDLSNGATGCSTATGTSGATIPLLNGTNTWSGVQSFNDGDLGLKGSSSGTTTLKASAAAGSTTITFPAATDTVAVLGTTDQTLSGGVNLTAFSIGTVSSGTSTIDCGKNPAQYLTNGGAFTLAAPSNDGTCLVMTINNGSAGAITFSGFSVGSSTGDALDTTNAHKFTISVWRINGTSGYRIAAMQ